MALVERLMDLESPRIRVHDFFAANHERIEGRLTRQSVIDMFALDTASTTEYDALAALAPTGTSALATAQKAMFINQVHSVFILAEGRYAGYETPANVRTKLGL
jgi:hypothetical protein